MLIELCASNELMTASSALEKAGFDVLVYDCLDRCEACAVAPYAMVEGIYMESDSLNRLLCTLLDIGSQDQDQP